MHVYRRKNGAVISDFLQPDYPPEKQQLYVVTEKNYQKGCFNSMSGQGEGQSGPYLRLQPYFWIQKYIGYYFQTIVQKCISTRSGMHFFFQEIGSVCIVFNRHHASHFHISAI